MTTAEKLVLATVSVLGWVLGIVLVIRRAMIVGRPSLLHCPEPLESSTR